MNKISEKFRRVVVSATAALQLNCYLKIELLHIAMLVHYEHLFQRTVNGGFHYFILHFFGTRKDYIFTLLFWNLFAFNLN